MRANHYSKEFLEAQAQSEALQEPDPDGGVDDEKDLSEYAALEGPQPPNLLERLMSRIGKK